MMRLNCDYDLIRNIADIELENFKNLLKDINVNLKNDTDYVMFFEYKYSIFCKHLKKVLQRLTPLNVIIKTETEVSSFRYEGVIKKVDTYIIIDDITIKHYAYKMNVNDICKMLLE